MGAWYRRWNGIDDRIQVTNGRSPISTEGALIWDAGTMAALVRKQRDGQVEWIMYNVSIGGSPCIGIGFNASNQVTMRREFTGTVRHTTTNTVTISDGWVIVAVSKTAGTTTPRAHIWKQDTGWAHEDMDGTLGNPPSQENGYVEMGVDQGFIPVFSQIDLETVAEWQVAMSDGEVEELGPSWGTFVWLQNSAAAPHGLWNYNQSDVVLPTDLSGYEADEIGVLIGTEALYDPDLDWGWLPDVNPLLPSRVMTAGRGQ